MNDFDHLSDETDMVVLTVCEDIHWKMYTAHLKSMEIRGWDSLCTFAEGGKKHQFHTTALKQWFADHCKESEEEYWKSQMDKWSVNFGTELSAQQSDGHNCGVFLILNFLCTINSWDHHAKEMTGKVLNFDGKVRLWILLCILRGEFVDPFQRSQNIEEVELD